MLNLFNLFNSKRSGCKKEIYTGKMKQVGFIVGTGRCGTTILASVLNAHSKICIPHELHFIVHRGLYEKYLTGEAQRFGADDFINFIRERCPYNFDQYFDYVSHFKNLRYPQQNLRILLTGLFDNMCNAAGKDVFLEQTPWHGLHLNTLKGLFPDMKVIHLIRDGRDVAISFARTPWWSKDIMANLERWGNEANLAHTFCLENPESSIELRYEDLIVQPEVALNKILRLFSLNFEQNMLDPENLFDYLPLFKGDTIEVQSDQFKRWGREKKSIFFSGSIYGWKKREDNAFDVMSEKVKEALIQFGYEV